MDSFRKQGYLLENFRLFHLSSPQGTRTEFHYHEFCKILLLLSGSGSYSVDGKRYLLRPGDVVLIRDGSIHRPELEARNPYERIIIYISPEYLRRVSTDDGNFYGIFSGEQGHVLRLPENQAHRLLRRAEGLEKDLAQQGFGREILADTGLLRLLVEIGRAQSRGDALDAGVQMPQNERIRDILGYIHGHLAEDLDAQTLAERFFISKYHMMRLFRQETGTTLHLYITQRRLMLARDLIRKGMKATEACYQSGFHSYSSFTRACEKHLGTTPTGRSDGTPVGEGEYE